MNECVRWHDGQFSAYCSMCRESKFQYVLFEKLQDSVNL